jgi:hypothetical protein
MGASGHGIRAKRSKSGAARSEPYMPVFPPVQEKLSAEESAAARAQLFREIETLPAVDLRARAIAILKAKNRLPTADAKLIEELFAARMALRAEPPEAFLMEEPSIAPANPKSLQLASGSTIAVKPPSRRGRP